MRGRLLALVFVFLAVSPAGCGKATKAGPPPTPSCTPSGTALQIVAKDIRFSTDCLAMKANTPFTVAFENQDAGVVHNFAIHTGHWMYSVAAPWLFMGEDVTGTAATTYQVAGLAPGTYVFMCDIHHDQMTGHFLVTP